MPADFPVTIYHNPRCGTSRKVVEMVKSAGHDARIVAYLDTGWTRDQLTRLMRDAGAGAKDFLRTKEAAAADLGHASDDAILAAMVADPILVERPIVVTPKGTRLCRPAEAVQDLL